MRFFKCDVYVGLLLSFYKVRVKDEAVKGGVLLFISQPLRRTMLVLPNSGGGLDFGRNGVQVALVGAHIREEKRRR